ncbi:MAG: hypothetical protein QXK12_02865 [Candidatus Nezhaarchaeales archaeon]
MSNVVVATTNAKKYYEVVKELRRLGISFTSCHPRDKLPKNVKVVITTQSEAPLIRLANRKTVIRVIEEPLKRTISRVVSDLQRSISPELVVGIDPGGTCGIAVILDRTLMDYYMADSVNGVVSYVEEALKTYEAQRKIIRIGDGTPQLRESIIKALTSKHLNAKVEVVSEKSKVEVPSIYRGLKAPRDVKDAVKIAFEEGVVVSS